MPLEPFPMVLPVAFLVLGVFAPGRGAALVAALGVAGSLLGAGLFPLWPTTVAWAALWIALGWFVSVEDAPSSARAGGAESGAIALVTGLVACGLLLVACFRQQLPPAESARVATGLAILGLGVLHLMLRRNTVRAAAAFGALGLGLHALFDAARRATIEGHEAERLGWPLAAGVAAALAIRLGRTRREVAGSAAVSDAHDLHD